MNVLGELSPSPVSVSFESAHTWASAHSDDRLMNLNGRGFRCLDSTGKKPDAYSGDTPYRPACCLRAPLDTLVEHRRCCAYVCARRSRSLMMANNVFFLHIFAYMRFADRNEMPGIWVPVQTRQLIVICYTFRPLFIEYFHSKAVPVLTPLAVLCPLTPWTSCHSFNEGGRMTLITQGILKTIKTSGSFFFCKLDVCTLHNAPRNAI